MQPGVSPKEPQYHVLPRSIGRIASVTGSKAILLLDVTHENDPRNKADRPEMGTLLAIDTGNATVLATVSALSVPLPAHGNEQEIRIAELGLVGELSKSPDGKPIRFHRGTSVYPALGDRVRFATKYELQLTYTGNEQDTVRIGSIHQESSIPAMIRVDELLGKHFAILGTTGTGKSCTTALIFRAILERTPNAHIVLLDPHNEYATAFGARAEVISPRTLQLPLWLLNFEEAVEVLVGDPERKAEIEILQELIPLAKARYSVGRAAQDQQKLRKPGLDASKFTVDTPVPYRISDLTSLIDERMGRLENRKDLAPYRALKTRIETFAQDSRYAFMFGSVTVYDGMTQVLSRIFRVPVNGKPITILELTGLPPEVVNVVVSVLCRMAFDFALWGEGKIPITVVCEEAHRYVPLNPQTGFEPCKRAIARIAKEGRKYGASLCIVTQRPAEIDPTILSQCNTVFALRMSNDRDQAIVASAVSDTGSGLVEFLPALGAREAIAFGDGVPIPVRIRFDELPADALPRSTTAVFSERWQESLGDESFLESVVERWRAAGVCGQIDAATQAQLLAEAVNLPSSAGTPRRAEQPEIDERAAPKPTAEQVPPLPEPPAFERAPIDRAAIEREVGEFVSRRTPQPLSRNALPPEPVDEPQPVVTQRPAPPPLHRPAMQPPIPRNAASAEAYPAAPPPIPRAAPAAEARPAPPPAPEGEQPPPPQQAAESSNSRLALRERLLRPSVRR
ncbi:ATP-binding protein [Hyphomicrobium sp. CS1GBMeth3]|uniref:ATP-binding protein n=1 Tax=Hyphomicrobium sp. CS1GBMeth3 TaxID=1892845 RepID=UPI000931041E|nr:ATP-binding protein [Hyphomicrobium sp. CS1GBMeth3]